MNQAPHSACLRSAAFLALGPLAIMACNDGAVIEPRLSELKKVMNTACSSFSVCHKSADMRYGNLKLSDPDAYCSLVGAMGGTTYLASARALYPRRVEAGDRGKSFLYKKLVLTDAEMGRDKPLGARMPLGGRLEPHEIEAFGKWIDEGARDDTGGALCP